MVKIEFRYSVIAQDDPCIELACTEAELAEAREKLSSSQFIDWVTEVAAGVSHAEAMAWALES